MTKMKRLISFIILAFVLTGCATQTSTKETHEDYSKFIADTEELTALFQEVYDSKREFTTDEVRAVNRYDAMYGKDSDFKGQSDSDIRLITTFIQLLYFDAKRMEGVDDTFAKDLQEINDRLADVKSKK